jgi:hypothetical protein
MFFSSNAIELFSSQTIKYVLHPGDGLTDTARVTILAQHSS